MTDQLLMDEAVVNHKLLLNPRVALTKAGWGFLLLIAGELLMALNFNNNPLFAMCFLSVALLFPTYWQTAKNIRQIFFQQWAVDRVFVGDTIEYRLELREQGGFQHEALSAEAAIDGDSTMMTLKPEQSDNLVINTVAVARGCTQEILVKLVSKCPLGLFRASIHLPSLPAIVIYPAARGQQALPESNKECSDVNVAEDSLSGLRTYREGDRINRIAWKASARSVNLMSHEYDGADELSALSLDWQYLNCNAVEEKLSQLCAWVLEADRQGLEYSFRLPGVTYDIGSGVDHRDKCLQALALYSVTGKS